MAVYQRILEHTTSRVESPAKVFAKLKSKVDREASCGVHGVCTRKDLMGKVKEKHGAEFKSPRKRTDRNWITDEPNENVCEARALTISPMSSPQRNFGYSHPDWSNKPAEDALCVGERGHGCTPRKAGLLESTVDSQPFYIASKTQGLTEAPQLRDSFDVIHRTQQQRIQAAENELMLEEVHAPLTPSSSAFSPMRSKLRKRKLESWGLHKEPCPLGELQTPKNSHSEDLVHLKGFSTRRFDKNQLAPESMVLAPSFPAKTRSSVVEDKVHLLSPAKMFAYMKERESKPEQHEGCKLAGSRNLFGCIRGNFHRPTAPPAPSIRRMEEDTDSMSFVESGPHASQLDVELADSQLDTDASEDVRVPPVLSHRVLLEDPLILNSPQVSIPKKCGPASTRKNLPLPANYPCENGIHLSSWFLRRKGKDLFVEGIHREKNIPWNSNIIMDRVSDCVLKTITGSFYILDGKMNLRANTGFPKWFLKKFYSGFPSNWNKLYKKFLSAKKENTEGRGSLAMARSEANFIMPPPPVARKATQSARTPENCPPNPPTSTKVSRSGRLIKPPLEYWKGGRVLIDAHMNVTIHESYDTSLCNPEDNATMSLRPSARLFLPSNDCQPSKAATAKETSGPLRKLKLPASRRTRARTNHSEKASVPPEAPSKSSRRRISSSSSEGENSRRQRSSRKDSAVKQTLRANGDAHEQTENSSTLRKPRKRKPNSKKPPVTASGRERSASASRCSPASDADTNDLSSAKESVATRRSQRRREVRSYREEESHQSGKAATKTSRAPRPGGAAIASEQKRSKATKASGRAKPAQSSKRGKDDGGNAPGQAEEEDQHKWTESELMKLNEAVNLYPRHMGDHWAQVARTVGTRSAEECHMEHTFRNVVKSPVKKQTKKSEEAKQPGTGSQASQDKVVISARVGTLRRKKQVRQFLENMPKDNHDDIFTLDVMKNKAFERACPFSTTNNQEFTLSNLGPLTPAKAPFPLVKTPHALTISPDMLGSPNCVNDDKLVYHLQKKVKKNQVNVCKPAPKKSFIVTPSVKRAVKRCGNTENDNFVVWEMFPGKDSPILSDSEEEKDFYFSDDD